MLTAKSLGQRN